MAVCLATKLFTFGVVGRCRSEALISTIVGDFAPRAADWLVTSLLVTSAMAHGAPAAAAGRGEC